MPTRWLSFALKAAVSGLLIWLLLDRIELDPVADRFGRLVAAPLLLAGLLLACQALIAGQRWRFVMDALEAPLALWPALRIYLIGVFFNQALPSTIGGDAFRVWLSSRLGVPLGKAVTGVLLDRLSGLFVILVVLALTLPALFALVAEPVARWSLVMVAGAGLSGYAIGLLLPRHLGALLGRWRPTRAVLAVSEDARRVFLAPAQALRVLGLALVVFAITAMTVYVLGLAVGVDLGLVNCFVLAPPIIIVSVVPVSLAGWGVREGAMVVAFGYVGVPAADALVVSILFGLLLIGVGLPGGLLWLAGGGRVVPARVPAPAESRGQPS